METACRRFLVFALALHAAFCGVAARGDGLKVIERTSDLAALSSPRGTNQVDTIILHFSSDVAANPSHPYDVDRNIQLYRQAGSSVHYLIDRQGNVYRLVSEGRIARHAGDGQLPWPPYHTNSLDDFSIGIELLNVSSEWRDMQRFISREVYDHQVAAKDKGYTDAQYNALNALISDIRSRWPLVQNDGQHIIGHRDYAPGIRTDPGSGFDWTKIGLPARVRPPSGMRVGNGAP